MEKEFCIKATGRDKVTYEAYFRYPTLEDYDYILALTKKSYDLVSQLDTDILFVKMIFVRGDKEMVDVDNHFDLFNSYRREIYKLFNVKIVYEIELENGDTEITLIDENEYNLEYALENYDITYDNETKLATFRVNKIAQPDATEEEFSVNFYKTVFRYPQYDDYKYYLQAFASNKMVSTTVALAEKCYVSGDKNIMNVSNPSFVYSASGYFSNILRSYEFDLKKK